MAMFRDSMDSSRTVEPVETKGDKTLCRVYFDKRYVGKVEIAARLFDPAVPRNQYIGFMPVTAEGTVVVPETRERGNRSPRDRKDYQDRA